jgi:lipopolysaccharide heptosyltransferase II
VRILLVRLRLIGDVVFTTPLLRALRRHYPQAHLTYVVEPTAAAVLTGNPHLDHLLVIPRSSGLGRLRDDWRISRTLGRQRFDLAIDLHGGPRSAWLTWASGAPMRVGYRIKGRSWMYTHVVPRAADLLPRHSVANQWDLLAPLGIGPCDPARDAVEMVPDDTAAGSIDRRLTAAGISASHRLVMLHVSAGNPFRRWPAESFAALVVELARRDRARRFMITSGPSDAAAARTVAELANARLGDRPPVVAHGEFSIGELRALAARAAVYIGNDSGPLHIAATTEAPIVALFGPTLPERSMPWRDPRWYAEPVDVGPLPCRPCHQRTCVPGDFRCLNGISVDAVVAAAERALNAVAPTMSQRA